MLSELGLLEVFTSGVFSAIDREKANTPTKLDRNDPMQELVIAKQTMLLNEYNR